MCDLLTSVKVSFERKTLCDNLLTKNKFPRRQFDISFHFYKHLNGLFPNIINVGFAHVFDGRFAPLVEVLQNLDKFGQFDFLFAFGTLFDF